MRTLLANTKVELCFFLNRKKGRSRLLTLSKNKLPREPVSLGTGELSAQGAGPPCPFRQRSMFSEDHPESKTTTR